jgi:ubiquitin thioesterase protein OTUB1
MEELRNRDEETLKQMEEIQSTVETLQPLIGPSVSVDKLLSYYQENELPGFLDGIRYLSSKYPRMRNVRGDGNCFYRSNESFQLINSLFRSLLFSFLEEIVIGLRSPEPFCVTAQSEYRRFYDTILKSKEELIAIGYDEFTFEFFFDVRHFNVFVQSPDQS